MTDFAVMQIGKTLLFSFTLPRLATDDERLNKPQEVEILREVIPAGTAASASSVSVAPWKSLGPDEVEKLTPEGKFVLTIPLSAGDAQPGSVRFAARTITRGFRHRRLESELSNSVQISMLEVPEAVQGLRAMTTEKSIDLAWQPTAPAASAYRLFRSTAENATFAMLTETVATEYRDVEFEFDRTYLYRVTAIVREGTTVAAAEDSETIEITARDTFPPAAPGGLTALYTADAVELIWNASPETDLRGYNVYRQENGAPEARMTTEPLGTPIFRDAKLVSGKQYLYHVTALDAAGNESLRSEGTAAEVR